MRLLNPGVGEITDRLTILSLKLLYGTAAGKPTAHFTTERASLLSLIRSRELGGPWFEQVLSLGAVNAALWQAEDALRAFRRSGGPPDEAVSIACSIQDLNDQRNQLVEAINKIAGDHIGSEK